MKDVPGIPRIWIALFTGLILAAGLLALVLFQKRPSLESSVSQAQPGISRGANPASALSGTSGAADAARRAAIAAQGALKHKGINAADLYRNAAALYAQLTDKEKALLRRPRKELSADEAAALYAKLQPIMDLLRAARAANYFDWGAGPMTPASDIGARFQMERNLSTMALWESDYRFQDDPAGAVSDLAALEAMGRDGVDSMLGLMVMDSNHGSIVNLLAQNAGSLGSAAGADLSELLSAASVQQSFQGGLNAEAAMAQAMMDDYNNPATRGQSFVQSLVKQNGVTPPANAEVQWVTQTEQALANSLQEPNAQFQQWWSQQLSQASTMPFANQILPSLDGVRTKTQASLVQNAMLQAGIALVQNDQAAFQTILDPTTGQPFIYVQTTNGFQLGSTMQVGGKPVTMTFASPLAK
ncbi:MAG TPA: hypothetical protein VHY22_05530 [Chthoniobacteraceae bacterium]|jgi:hypothetical protein|nr:hypothetical protein [Chthoniobacteraceae bacterium]